MIEICTEDFGDGYVTIIITDRHSLWILPDGSEKVYKFREDEDGEV